MLDPEPLRLPLVSLEGGEVAAGDPIAYRRSGAEPGFDWHLAIVLGQLETATEPLVENR